MRLKTNSTSASKLFGALLPLCLLSCLLWLSSCSGLLYFPTRNLHYDPAKLGLKPDEIFFPSKNGEKLFGWHFSSQVTKKPKAVVLFFHGNGENLSSHYLSLTWLLKHPYDFFIFDYQGYGRSSGEPSPQKTVEDGLAALDWLHKKYPHTPIVIFGQSLGGAVALRVAIEAKDHPNIRFVALDSTFPSYRSMGRKVLSRSALTWPLQWLGWLVMSDSYAPKGRIAEINVPILVIHGDKDRVVEFEMGERVFAEAKEPKEFWTIRGGGHTDIFTLQDDSYKTRFLNLMEKSL